MKVLKMSIAIFLFKTTVCVAQVKSRLSAGIDVGSGFTSNSWAPSVLYHEDLGPRNLPWLRVVLGFRAWGYYGGKMDLESQNDKDLRQELQYRHVSSNGISLVTGMNIKVWKVDLGANTDLIGLALGTKRSAYYAKNTQTPGAGQAYYNTWVSTAPTILTALPLVLEKAAGQSEVHARIWITRSLGLKLGYLYGRQVYLTRKVEDKRVFLDHGQRYFSSTHGMPYAALAFSLDGSY